MEIMSSLPVAAIDFAAAELAIEAREFLRWSERQQANHAEIQDCPEHRCSHIFTGMSIICSTPSIGKVTESPRLRSRALCTKYSGQAVGE